jgi:alkaline phosphatase D
VGLTHGCAATTDRAGRAARRASLRVLAIGAAAAASACGGRGRVAAPAGPAVPLAPGESVFAPGGTDPAAATEWRGDADPFVLGVASGLPRADGATLWTRLAPRPLADDGGMPPAPVRVRWEVGEADGGPPLRSGVAVAEPGWAHSVRVELRGLAPGRVYRYRFASGAAASAAGRFRTAPPAGGGARLRLVFASCQQYEQGFYAAWRHAAADDPDLVIFLGDYVYESSWGRRHVRKHDPGTATTLAGYRRRHALYRGDADLQRAHAACAWVPTWDDHEVDNDYAAGLSQGGDPTEVFLARRAAAYRAWFEHMPLPWSMAPAGPSMRIHGHVDWGGLARIHVLDDRQYRTPQACSPPGHAGSRTVGDECAARLDPARTMLGAEQEAWFERSVRGSDARWNLVAQQTLMGRCDWRPGPEVGWWTDGWDGYPLARRRLLAALRDARAANPIALGGDVHTFYAGELHEDFDRPGPAPAMIEFVGGSISSQGPPQGRIDAIVRENPNLRYGGAARGYGRLDLDAHGARVAIRAIDDAADAASGCRTVREFAVRAGVGRLEG